jgi:hypothetical protein
MMARGVYSICPNSTSHTSIYQANVSLRHINRMGHSHPIYRITREANPKMLEMNDGDQIDVQLTQVGGRR